MNKILLVIATIILMSSNLMFGQFTDWTSYVNPEYLTDYVETNDKIWFSSKAGVFEMDKLTLQMTEHNRSNAAIPSNEVEGIAVDGNGFIWIGTYEQAIGKFDGNDWTSIPYPTNLFGNVNTVQTYCIEVDNQNVVWVGTSEGLVKYDGTNWQLYNSQNGVPSMQDVWAMEIDNQGNLFVASFYVYKYDGSTFQQITDNTNFSLYEEVILKKQSNGDMWLAGFSGLLGKYDGTNWTEFKANNGDIPQKAILDLGENANGEMCVTFYDEGKFIFQNGAWNEVVDIVNAAIDTTNITTYFYDNGGNEWIGSHNKLLKNSGQNTVINLKSHTINNNRFVRDISVDANGKMYVVNGSEVATFDGTNWSNLTLPTQLQTSFFSILNHILFTANDDVFLVASSGMYYWNGTIWTHYTDQNGTLPTNTIYDLQYDENTQTLWIATNVGLVKFDGMNFTTYDASNTILTNSIVSRFNLDNNGLVYIVNNQKDVFTFDGTTWTDISATILPTIDVINTLHFDKDNMLWIGGRYEGLYKLENGNWETFTSANSDLPDARINSIVSNSNGKLFAATAAGLVTLENGNIEIFTTQNSGISNDDVKLIAFDYSDNLWLGTAHGVSVLALNATNTQPIVTKNNTLKVFPNPIRTTASVTFDLKNSTDNIRVRIINVEGKTIQEQLINGRANYGEQQLEINRNQIANGLYYLSIQTDFEQLIQPILIQD